MSSFEHIADRDWDVVVVGAGPAGSLAARQLARHGARVLLVDRAPLGRRKVCGCCLNIAALETLEAVNLADLIHRHGAVPLQSVELAANRCQATIPLPGGVSLSREALDTALIEEAITSGAMYFPETNAALGRCENSFRHVELTNAGETLTVRVRVVLAADGLGGKLLARNRHVSNVAQAGSRIGAGAIMTTAPPWVGPGRIYMACSKRGYVGLVVLEDGRLNVAAAFDREAVRQAGGPGSLAANILAEVGWHEITGLGDEQWQGTMALTRKAARTWDERVMVLGDAAGYVEPFTGEGMAWALAAAVAITPAALRAVALWTPSVGAQWELIHRQTVVERQSTCRTLAHALRHPWLVRTVIRLVGIQPSLAKPVVRRLSAG